MWYTYIIPGVDHARQKWRNEHEKHDEEDIGGFAGAAAGATDPGFGGGRRGRDNYMANGWYLFLPCVSHCF